MSTIVFLWNEATALTFTNAINGFPVGIRTETLFKMTYSKFIPKLKNQTANFGSNLSILKWVNLLTNIII